MNNLTALGLIALSLGLGFFIGKPMYADISDLSMQKEQYAAALESFGSLATLKQTLEKKLENLPAAEKTKIETLLPSRPDTIKLISDIDVIASHHGIAIDDVAFEPNTGGAGKSIADAAPQRHYNSGMINISFSASYENLKGFLGELESSLRLVDIRDISVNAGEKGAMSYKVGAEIYWLPSPTPTNP